MLTHASIWLWRKILTKSGKSITWHFISLQNSLKYCTLTFVSSCSCVICMNTSANMGEIYLSVMITETNVVAYTAYNILSVLLSEWCYSRLQYGGVININYLYYSFINNTVTFLYCIKMTDHFNLRKSFQMHPPTCKKNGRNCVTCKLAPYCEMTIVSWH